MKVPKLKYPVYTLDNRLLLPAGTRLMSEALEALISKYRGIPYQPIAFLDYGTVYQDFLRLIQKPPYHIIFGEAEKLTAMSTMENISFIPPVLEFLDYFKEIDIYTYQHILIVFALAAIMAQSLLAKSKDRIAEAMAGHMHDFGKICVPPQILKKSTPLTRAERNILEHHTLAGFVLLSYFLQDSMSFAARVAKEHHERRDGSGYPLGISLSNRMVEIISACDVYDALLSSRPYRLASYDNRTALEEITEMAHQGKLSWGLVQTLVSFNRQDRSNFEECKVSTEKRGTPPAGNLYGIIEDANLATGEDQDD